MALSYSVLSIFNVYTLQAREHCVLLILEQLSCPCPWLQSTEWWEARGRGEKHEHPLAWHAPNTAFGRAVGNLRTWKKGEPDLTKQAGSESDLDVLLATASERKVCLNMFFYAV
jgi:hypothetical protein